MTNEEAIEELQGYKQYCRTMGFRFNDWREALDMAIEALKQTAWILCEERLPEVDEDVLILYHFDSDNEEFFPSHDGVKISYWTGVTNHKIPQFAEMGDRTVVKAWMPLPKPYEGGTE